MKKGIINKESSKNLKFIEKSSGISDLEMNSNVLQSLKTVKVYSTGDENLATANKKFDKRPKKENEEAHLTGESKPTDGVFENYGYNTPKKIRPGNLTLQQFDMFINEYKKEKSIDVISKFGADTKIDMTTLYVFLENYKPFLKFDGKGGKAKNANEQLKLESVFPNVK